MKSLELVGKCFKTLSHDESQEDCYGLWRRSHLNSFSVLSKSCTYFFWPARSYVTQILFKSSYVTTPLGGTRYATTGVNQQHLCKTWKWWAIDMCIFSYCCPHYLLDLFHHWRKHQATNLHFCSWCKGLNHMYLLHIVDYEVSVKFSFYFVIFSLWSFTLEMQSGHLSHLFFHTGKDWIDLAHWAAYLCRHF